MTEADWLGDHQSHLFCCECWRNGNLHYFSFWEDKKYLQEKQRQEKQIEEENKKEKERRAKLTEVQILEEDGSRQVLF